MTLGWEDVGREDEEEEEEDSMGEERTDGEGRALDLLQSNEEKKGLRFGRKKKNETERGEARISRGQRLI